VNHESNDSAARVMAVSGPQNSLEEAVGEVQRRFSSLSNWGRWGRADQLGTAQLTTPESVKAAAVHVRTGEVFSLGLPLGSSGPMGLWTENVPRSNPIHLMTKTGLDDGDRPGPHFAEDAVFMPLQASTQWDSLGHVHYGGSMYNGHSVENITSRGLEANSIDRLSERLVGRGVLLDVAGASEANWLVGGQPITSADLDDVAAAQGVELRPGDHVLVRTGWLGAYLRGELSRDEFMRTEPGLGLDVLRWLHSHSISAIAVDNFGVEVIPAENDLLYYPFHMIAIRDMGLTLGEFFALDKLADACRSDGRYDFLFVAPPLPFEKAAGSPVNPLAIR
jgi:kynurenine formamidase